MHTLRRDLMISQTLNTRSPISSLISMPISVKQFAKLPKVRGVDPRVQALTASEVSWIAGLIDADGSIGLICFRNSNKYAGLRPKIEIGNTYIPLLERLQQKLGGYISRKGGKLILPPLTSAHLLRRVREWLIVKAQTTELILQWLDYRKSLPHNVTGKPRYTNVDVQYYLKVRESVHSRRKKKSRPKAFEQLLKQVSEHVS